jgi:hypothetical protein
VSPITDSDYQHWRDHGYVVVKVLEDTDVKAATANVHQYMPSWEEYTATPLRYPEAAKGTVNRTFPFTGTALNAVSVHAELLSFAERVLRSTRLMIDESQLIGKYAGGPDFDQSLHLDYTNTTLACPKRDDQIVDLPMITYYTDVTLELGPTYLVPQDLTRHLPLNPRRRDRERFPEMYESEIAITVPAGSTLVYSMRTWHRGSAMTAATGARYSHHMGFRRADVPWCGQFTFQHEGGRPEMDDFLEAASPRQRELVGFPPVGDPYWDAETIAGVAGRYPGMDMGPYREGIG